jgi:hypothetical protein
MGRLLFAISPPAVKHEIEQISGPFLSAGPAGRVEARNIWRQNHRAVFKLIIPAAEMKSTTGLSGRWSLVFNIQLSATIFPL